jgi:hypothetical protein
MSSNRDNAPAWVKERRRPTRAELAAKHFADGGTVGPAGSENNLDDFVATLSPATAEDFNFAEVEMKEIMPGVMAPVERSATVTKRTIFK